MCDRLYLIDRATVKAGAEITSPTREAVIKRALIALFAGGDGNGMAGKGIGTAEDGEKYSTIASINVEMAIYFTKITALNKSWTVDLRQREFSFKKYT